MAERKMRYAVLTHFERYQKVGNKARYQWDADNLLESYSYEEIKKVIDYFFVVSRAPTWSTLVYNFDEYRSQMYERQKDIEHRKKNLERMKAWMNE